MGAERVAAAFRNGHTAFMPYAMLGHPNPAASLKVVQQLSACGADLLELGVPFSDPLADGPVIQAAAQHALEEGVTLADCIAMVGQLRSVGLETPALLMSYINPILAHGIGRCVADSARAGVDGFIVPDLPPEEANEMEASCRQHGLALVYLLAPTSPPERLALVARRTQGFIYLVSLTGVTGARDTLPPDLAEFVARVRFVARVPLAVGFGIKSGEQARMVGELADGVIVGSALVELAGGQIEQMVALAHEIAAGVRSSSVGRCA
jgi:tryptophan synthase alpha chain